MVSVTWLLELYVEDLVAKVANMNVKGGMGNFKTGGGDIPAITPTDCPMENVNLLTYLLTYFLTYLLTPRSRVLLEKLTGLQLVKKFLAFYGTRRFITAFTSARHLSLS